MKTQIVNAKIVTAERVVERGVCTFENGVIAYVGTEKQNSDRTIDVGGRYLLPGFVDVHCHGGNGFDFMDATAAEMKKIADFHLSHGTTTMLATTLAASEEETLSSLDTFASYKRENADGTLVGVHLEGPCLSPLQCGAQAVESMRSPKDFDLRAIKERYPFVLKVSAAPELDGGFAFGRTGKELGVTMSAAHTDADWTEMERALENGYSSVTHLYSGMKGVTRKNSFRTAGAVEAGLYLNGYTVEVISDGRHLPPELLKFIYKCKGADKICLVTDGTRAAGMKNGSVSTIGSLKNGLPVVVEDEVAKLLDRQSFAGSTATFDRLYRVMAAAIGKDMVALSKMSSLTPARSVGLFDRGEIAVGKRADMLVASEDLEIKEIYLRGERI